MTNSQLEMNSLSIQLLRAIMQQLSLFIAAMKLKSILYPVFLCPNPTQIYMISSSAVQSRPVCSALITTSLGYFVLWRQWLMKRVRRQSQALFSSLDSQTSLMAASSSTPVFKRYLSIVALTIFLYFSSSKSCSSAFQSKVSNASTEIIMELVCSACTSSGSSFIQQIYQFLLELMSSMIKEIKCLVSYVFRAVEGTRSGKPTNKIRKWSQSYLLINALAPISTRDVQSIRYKIFLIILSSAPRVLQFLTIFDLTYSNLFFQLQQQIPRVLTTISRNYRDVPSVKKSWEVRDCPVMLQMNCQQKMSSISYCGAKDCLNGLPFRIYCSLCSQIFISSIWLRVSDARRSLTLFVQLAQYASQTLGHNEHFFSRYLGWTLLRQQ